MSRQVEGPGWRLAVLLMVGAVFVLPASAEPPGMDPIEARVRELHAKSSEAKVTLLDGTVLQGRIVLVGADSFTLRQKKGGRETAIRYAHVKEVQKTGLARRTKAILVSAAVAGSAFMVLCAAPYPIGFLCRKDPD